MMHNVKILNIFLALFLLTPSVWAEQKASEPVETADQKPKLQFLSQKPKQPTDATPSLFMGGETKRLVYGTLFFLVFFGVAFLIRFRPLQLKGARNAPSPKVRSIAVHSLGHKNILHLIEVEGEKLLMNVNPQEVKLIKEIQKATTRQEDVLKPSQQPHLYQPAPPREVQRPSTGSKKYIHAAKERPAASAERLPSPPRSESQDTAKTQIKGDESISDIRKLIREKMKNLPHS